MNTMTFLIRLSLLALLTAGLSACGVLIPAQVTETINIDQTNSATVKLEGEFIDLFPFIEIVQKIDSEYVKRLPIEKNAELKQKIANSVIKSHGKYITSQKNSRYQVEKVSTLTFQSASEGRDLSTLRSTFSFSELGILSNPSLRGFVTNEDQSRTIVIQAIDLTRLLPQQTEEDDKDAEKSKQRAQIINAFQQRLLSKGSYQVIIDTDQSVIAHNAQKVQPLADGKRTRYEWQFNYADLFKSALNDQNDANLIEMVLPPAVGGNKSAEGE